MSAKCFAHHTWHRIWLNQGSSWYLFSRGAVTFAEIIQVNFYLLGERHFLNLITICPIRKLFSPFEYITRFLEDQSPGDRKCPGTGASAARLQSHLQGKLQHQPPVSSEKTRAWDLGTSSWRPQRPLFPGCSWASLTRSRAHHEFKEELHLEPRSAHFFLSILTVTFKKNYKNHNGHCGKLGN